jgi:hypothetical protein
MVCVSAYHLRALPFGCGDFLRVAPLRSVVPGRDVPCLRITHHRGKHMRTFIAGRISAVVISYDETGHGPWKLSAKSAVWAS